MGAVSVYFQQMRSDPAQTMAVYFGGLYRKNHLINNILKAKTHYAFIDSAFNVHTASVIQMAFAVRSHLKVERTAGKPWPSAFPTNGHVCLSVICILRRSI